MDGETHVAMMADGQLLREGDSWGVFRVEKITPEFVILSHEAGSRVLRLGEIRPLSASGKVITPKSKEPKSSEDTIEARIRNLQDHPKSIDSAKLLKGFPQNALDSLTGDQKTPIDSK
jgi:hypothetical protein